MELKQFVVTVINDLTTAIEELNKSSKYEVHLTTLEAPRTVEIDTVVSAENTKAGGVNVFSLVNAGLSGERKNLLENRIKVGIYISSETKDKIAKSREEYKKLNEQYR
jgi:hypothetical protein